MKQTTEIKRSWIQRKPKMEPKEQNKKWPICKNMYFAHSSFKSACSKECESAHKKLQANKVKLAEGKKLRAVRKLKSSSGAKSTADERKYMGMVAALGCIVCSECLGYQDTPAIVHHIRTGQGKMRASHYDTMPLCPNHHQNSGYGIHDMGRKQFEDMYGKSELELLAIVKKKLGAA